MIDSAPDGSPPVLYHLSPRTVLRVRGGDRLRFLNGQLTQDIRLATTGNAVFSCVLNAKGQLDAVCHVRAHEDSYLLDAPRALRDVLLARLDRYLIADDVELGDESDQWHVAHTLAPPTPGEFLRWTTTRLATPGSDLFAPRAIALAGFADRDEEAFLRACTVAGVPTWDRELTPGLLPPDAGLDDTAISYEKGCYLGQEVISRMKRAGKTNQHLVVLRLPTGTPAGSTLLHDGREAGRVTSVAESRLSDQETPGLGFRARKFAELAEFTVCHPDGTMPPGTAKARPA